MKFLTVLGVFLSLLADICFAQIISEVDAPQDDLHFSWLCASNYSGHPELLRLSEKYNDLLRIRFFPLKQADVVAVFGPKLEKDPADFVKPLFVPPMIAQSGLRYSDSASKRHVDFYAIGEVAYLKVYYNFDGESLGNCVLYLRSNAQFVPITSTNDIPAREAWDKPRFQKLEGWLDQHLPKMTDLSVVELSLAHPTRMELGDGTVCVITTNDIHNKDVPFWYSFALAKETADLDERIKSTCYESIDRTNETVSFAMNGKFYKFVPRVVK